MGGYVFQNTARGEIIEPMQKCSVAGSRDGLGVEPILINQKCHMKKEEENLVSM